MVVLHLLRNEYWLEYYSIETSSENDIFYLFLHLIVTDNKNRQMISY